MYNFHWFIAKCDLSPLFMMQMRGRICIQRTRQCRDILLTPPSRFFVRLTNLQCDLFVPYSFTAVTAKSAVTSGYLPTIVIIFFNNLAFSDNSTNT